LAEIREQLDEFTSKREVVDMGKEDLVTLEKLEQERKRLEQLANESEKYADKGLALPTRLELTQNLCLLGTSRTSGIYS
jgi:hypothetical protein